MPTHPTLQRIIDPILIPRTDLPRIHVPQEPGSLLPRKVGLTDVQKVRSEAADEPFVEDLEDRCGAVTRTKVSVNQPVRLAGVRMWVEQVLT